jgi:branched-chain amino acid transport system permease protein
LFGVTASFNSTASLYWLALVLTVVMLFLPVHIRGSAFGLKLKAIAASEKLAESAGVSVFKYRLIILALSSLLLGLCGPIIAASTRLASPSNYGLDAGIDWLVYAALGARLGPFGPAIAAAVLVTLTQVVFTQIGVYRLILYGLLLILTVLLQKRTGSATK